MENTISRIAVLDGRTVSKVKRAAQKLGYKIQKSGKTVVRFFDTDSEKVFSALKYSSGWECIVNVDFGKQVGIIK